MLLEVTLLTALAVCTHAAPNIARRTASERLGLTWLGGNSSLPKILLLTTGGTIAGGSMYGALDDTEYGGGGADLFLTGEELVARNPHLLNHTQLAIAPFSATGTNDAAAMNMTRFVHDALCAADSDIAGAVFTHGTNSLEETAFLLDSLVNCGGKPIVGVGAMRPFTHLGYDGDANLFDAVVLAASPQARGRGVMVAFNARIIPGYWVTKLHSTSPDAFGAVATGDLGLFINSLPVFYNTPSQPLYKHAFDIAQVSSHASYPSLPRVDILYQARGFDVKAVLDAQTNGAEGIVFAGTGNGAVPFGADEIAGALAGGVQIVVSTRVPFGPSTPKTYQNNPTFARSALLHVIQSRIVLQLAIASGMSMNQTAALFEDGMRLAIGQPRLS